MRFFKNTDDSWSHEVIFHHFYKKNDFAASKLLIRWKLVTLWFTGGDISGIAEGEELDSTGNARADN